MQKESENTKCKNCGSSQTYIRLKTNERVCHVCMFIEKLKEVKQNA